MNLSEYVKFLAELSKDVNGDHIDWGMLRVDENELYATMALQVIENEGLTDIHIARATVIALLVENFALNMKLRTNHVAS